MSDRIRAESRSDGSDGSDGSVRPLRAVRQALLMCAASLVLALVVAANGPTPPRVVRGGLRSALYPDNWRPGYRDAKGRFLQDYSYAGYHNGEKPLPAGKHGKIFDVTAQAYGADKTGRRDSNAAIQKAIGDAEAAAGGIVYLPAGTYALSNGLRIAQSRIVLRGAGSRGPNATKLLFVDGGRQRHSILVGTREKQGTAQLLARDARIFDHHVVLKDVTGFQVGDHILIGCKITEPFIREHRMTEFWTERQQGRIRHFFRRRITRIDPTTRRVFFKTPIRYPMQLRDEARITKVTDLTEECGVEHLAISNATRKEEDAWAARSSWAAVSMQYVSDCWVRDVRSFESPYSAPFHLRSLGVSVRFSKQVTVADCAFARPQNRSGSDGYGVCVTGGNEILVRDVVCRYCRHGFSASWPFGSSGNVFLRVHSVDGIGYRNWQHRQDELAGTRKAWPSTLMTSDYHMHLAIACLVDNSVIDDGWLARNRRHMSANSGHTSTQCVFWNNRGKGRLKSYQYGWGYVIGTDGLDVRTTEEQAGPCGRTGKEDEGTAPYDFTEHIGTGSRLSVKSLYEDQLARRLGRGVRE